VSGCATNADGTLIITSSNDGTARLWDRDGHCLAEVHPSTNTRIWLDAATQTLQIEGAAWPDWQLVDSTGQQPNRLGSTIAALGPRAHETLVNAQDWNFAPL
jgi:WD40 repeat protein